MTSYKMRESRLALIGALIGLALWLRRPRLPKDMVMDDLYYDTF